MSLVASFLSLVRSGLEFNEQDTYVFTKWLLCLPLFMTSVAARVFTLAVFLKETSTSQFEWIGGIAVLVVYFGLNIATFRICGQDWIRSVVFGFSSTLIPAGYNNDEKFFQRPGQPLWKPSSYAVTKSTSVSSNNSVVPETEDISTMQMEPGPEPKKMKSGVFLIVHTVTSTVLLSGCAIYISLTRNLSETADNALILPQILAVIPGCFFTLARSTILFRDHFKPSICCTWAWHWTLYSTAVFLGTIAYGSLIPALFWSVLWKTAIGPIWWSD